MCLPFLGGKEQKMYKHEFRALLKNGDCIGYNFDYDNADFEHIIFTLASSEPENVNGYYIIWDKAVFDEDEDFMLVVKDREEILDCLVVMLDCISEQLRGAENLINSQKGCDTPFSERWINIKENLEMMEETAFLEYSRYSNK